MFLTRYIRFWFLILLVMFGISPAVSAPLSISNQPVYLGGMADPNIVFTLDDSGSMGWELMPDALSSSISRTSFPTSTRWNRRKVYDDYFDPTNIDVNQMRSVDVNTMYYDPTVRYLPWANSDGSFMANADPTCAHYDPMSPDNTTCVDFKVQASVCSGDCTSVNIWPANYFQHKGGSTTNTANYTHVEIKPAVTTYTGGADRSDCAAAPTCTYAEEVQNFANWFQYYRTRMMLAKAGVSRAFSIQGADLRVGFATINTGSRTLDGVTSNGAMLRGVRAFAGTDRTDWFNLLYNANTSGSTPLRRASNYVGQYYGRSDNKGPWGNDPGVNDTTGHSVCRQNYHILMSDGYWNGSSPSVGNVDNSNGPTITAPDGTTYRYTPARPYRDGYSDTLADVAMKYWLTDLRTDLVNAVPTTTADNAFWQHMSTFTVGLGLVGTLDPATDLPNLTDGSASWPSASSNQIDDMWHAAVNGHGRFFSAKNVNEFAAALADSLVEIKARQTTAAKAGLSSTKLQIDTDIYQAGLNTGDWSGSLFSTAISDGASGTVCPGTARGIPCPTPNWNAATVLTNSIAADPAHYNTGRKIATYKPSTHAAAPFRWANLDAAQQTVMKTNPDDGTTESTAIGMRRLDYLRGKADGVFRLRSNYLGDITYSAPAHIGPPKAGYPDDWNGAVVEPEDAAGKAYSTFKSAHSSRSRMVYVGANDGMMHAFDATTGAEVFAYVPGEVYGTVNVPNKDFGRINQLTSATYVSSHLYFVDGPISNEDVFYNNDWHSVIVGSLRGGGRGIYALDVTSATAADEAAVASKVLWEFTDADDADLGLTFGTPYIARMQNGKWAVVVGNGYNNSSASGTASTSGNAVLFILFFDADLTDGSWDLGTDYIKIDTRVGSTATPNGLASPTVTEVDADFIADYAYAGDLRGNMWKFDLTDSNPANWKVALGTVAAPVPLFTATAADGTPQVITTAPEVGAHSSGDGFMVYFGTGKLIEPSDNLTVGQQTQTVYGIWDKNGLAGGFSAFNRSHLLEQRITFESAVLGGYRVITDNPITWHDTAGVPISPVQKYLGWRMDLLNTQGGNTDNRGERQITDMLLAGGRLIYTTAIPSDDPCDLGGDGWALVVSPEHGGRLSFDALNETASVDIDGDGVLDTVYSSAHYFENIPSAPTLAKDKSQDRDVVYITDSSGNIVVLPLARNQSGLGRRSWQQLQ